MPVLKNPRWEAFARRRAQAVIHPESNKDSVRAIVQGLSEHSYKQLAVTMPKRPEIARRTQELIEAQDLQLARVAATSPNSQRTLRDVSLQEFIDWLSQAVFTPVGMIDEMSPLAQEVTIETSGKGTIERRRVKMVGKMEAAALLAKVKGWTQEAAVSILFPGFSATVRNVGPGGLPGGHAIAQERGTIELEVDAVQTVPELHPEAPDGQESGKNGE